jgi:hypothetical protein
MHAVLIRAARWSRRGIVDCICLSPPTRLVVKHLHRNQLLEILRIPPVELQLLGTTKIELRVVLDSVYVGEMIWTPDGFC